VVEPQIDYVLIIIIIIRFAASTIVGMFGIVMSILGHCN